MLLGHAKLEITQRYLNVTDVGVVRSMRELGEGSAQRGAAGSRVNRPGHADRGRLPRRPVRRVRQIGHDRRR
jgi:hypothetical protein